MKTFDIVLFTSKTTYYKCCRNVSSLGLWNQVLTTKNKLKIETHWANNIASDNNKLNDRSFYILPMFVCPLENLNMEHLRLYSLTDTIARYHRLNGNKVIHPIGWDAFGFKSELTAINSKILPEILTCTNIKRMKHQLTQHGFNFDDDKEIKTCHPDYYKWTQYIFLRLFEKGLAYQNRGKVYWDTIFSTVVENEHVDSKGYSLISGAKVEERILKQWYIKTSSYANMLYEGLDSYIFKHCESIVNKQKQMIGECNGMVVDMILKLENEKKIINVWSTYPYKFLHGEFITVSTKSILLNEISQENYRNLKCYNPITNTDLNVFVTDDVKYPKGRDVYIASPSIDLEDRKILEFLNISSNTTEHKIDIAIENEKAIKLAQDKKCGGYFVNSKHKDWLVSRQRFWGTPVPIIHCSNCGSVPVPYEQLPIKLPERLQTDSLQCNVSDFKSWIHCKCPQCSGDAQRDMNTLDKLFDTALYFYNFSGQNNVLSNNQDDLVESIPINCYYVFDEKTTLYHLFYARFMSYFLYSIGILPAKEPFKKLLLIGPVMGQSFKVRHSKKYLQSDSVIKDEFQYREKDTGKIVTAQWEKMCKSKYNTEVPQRLIKSYGCDTTKLIMIVDASPKHIRKWSDASFPNILNWQNRIWIIMRDFLEYRNGVSKDTRDVYTEKIEEYDTKLWRERNYYVTKINFNYKYTQQLNVVISLLQSLTKILIRKNILGDEPEIIARSKEYEITLAYLILMLSPMAPHFCSELWAGLSSAPHKICKSSNLIDWNREVMNQNWPKVDSNYPLSLYCKVNGCIHSILKIKASELPGLTAEQALEMMMREKSVTKKIMNGVSSTSLELYPECFAVLHLATEKRYEQILQRAGQTVVN